uniref:Putative secreted protein n=1 Tax=Ixodes ricinus TaxID=34613 RepID=A0A6B0UA40_IXORI
MLRFQTVNICTLSHISLLVSPIARAQLLSERRQQDIADDRHIGQTTAAFQHDYPHVDQLHRNHSSRLKLFNAKLNINLRRPAPSDHGPISGVNWT